MRYRLLDRRSDLPASLDRWAAAGIITPEQAERIRREDGVAAELDRRGASTAGRLGPMGPSLVTEALGYLGGVLIFAAAVMLVAQFWADLSLAARLVLVGLAAVLLVGAGLAVPARAISGPGRRLRAMLWLLATAATGAFLALLADEGLGWTGESVAMLAGSGAAVLALWLWRRSPTVIQQIAVVVPLVLTVAATTARFTSGAEETIGLAIWGVGTAWMFLGWGDLVRSRAAALALGGFAAVFGAMLSMTSGWWQLFAVATVAALLAVSILSRELSLLLVTSFGALQIVPRVVGSRFPGELAGPLALLIAGIVLVAAAVYVARRQNTRGAQTPAHDVSHGSTRAALVGATATAIGTLVAIVAVEVLG
jgi:hypothetical protein